MAAKRTEPAVRAATTTLTNAEAARAVDEAVTALRKLGSDARRRAPKLYARLFKFAEDIETTYSVRLSKP